MGRKGLQNLLDVPVQDGIQPVQVRLMRWSVTRLWGKL
jgi:hypothetical protein